MSDIAPGQPPHHDNPKAAAKAAKAYAKAMRPWYKKKRALVPAAFVAIVGFSTAANGGGDSTSNDTVESAQDTPAATTETSDAPKAEAPKADAPKAEAPKPDYAGALEDDKVATPGAEVKLSGWSVTAAPLAKEGTPLGDVICSAVSMTNRDDEQQEYNGLSWKLQTPNGNVQDITFLGDSDLTNGGLAPGGQVAKKVCFSDEAAGAGQYILSWQPDIFSSEARGVWLNQL